MSDHILNESVRSSIPEKIWRNNQHAGSSYCLLGLRYEYSDAGTPQSFQPYLLGAAAGLRWTADLGGLE